MQYHPGYPSSAGPPGEMAAMQAPPFPPQAPTVEEERKRTDCLDSMAMIEREFSYLKERLYSDKILAMKGEEELIKKEEHDEFNEQIKRLEHIRDQKAASANRWRQYQLDYINSICEAEMRQAWTEFHAEKRSLQERMINTLNEKRRQMEEENLNLTLSDGEAATETRMLTRRLRRRDDHDSFRRRPTTQNTPFIRYHLEPEEIQNDLQTINMGISMQGVTGQDPSRGEKYDVLTDRSYLFYRDQVFQRDSPVVIESQSHEGRVYAVITSITDKEIHVRYRDQSKGKVYLSHLRDGRYVLSPAAEQ